MVSKTYVNPNDGKLYHFSIDYDSVKGWHNFAIVNDSDNTKRVVRVVPCDEFVIKINKKTVAASGGVRGLFCFLSDCIKNDYMTAWCNVIIKAFPA